MPWPKTEMDIRREVEQEIVSYLRRNPQRGAVDAIETGDYYRYRAGPLPGSPTEEMEYAKRRTGPFLERPRDTNTK